jgi:hypothetical protein
MSNISGKAYAMSVVSPIQRHMAWINRIIFWYALLPFNRDAFKGLVTLSMIHYARWVIVSPKQFPRLDESQPKETIKYVYEFFCSNFNGSWDQYVDSFHMAIPSGLDLLWKFNVRYPESVPLDPFHRYINYNQIWNDHYYNAYPLASSNDVKSAQKIKRDLLDFIENTQTDDPETFQKKFTKLLLERQHDLSLMEPTPIVSLAAAEVADRVEKRKENPLQRSV